MIASSTIDSPYARLVAAGIVLPGPPIPIGNFLPWVEEGGLLYLPGQGPRESDGTMRTGIVGAELSRERAYEDARLTGTVLIANMHHALGDLHRVRRIVKVFGMVNAARGFADHPAVINGCSDLLVEIFGPTGAHARSAIGVGSLPGCISVEIEMIVAVRP